MARNMRNAFGKRENERATLSLSLSSTPTRYYQLIGVHWRDIDYDGDG